MREAGGGRTRGPRPRRRAVPPCRGQGAAAALALDSTGAAFLNATVGTEVGARAEAAGQDGSPNGITWIWVFQNGTQTAFRTALTRSSIVPEMHIGEFRGKFVAGDYAAYPKVLGGCEIQSCWAHRSRRNWADALLPEATPEADELAGKTGGVYREATGTLKSGCPRSRSLRTVLESEMRDALDRTRDRATPSQRPWPGAPAGACPTCSCSPSMRGSSRPTTGRSGR